MKTKHDELDPLAPERAQELYLKQKQMEASEKTVRSHRYRLNYFVQWCDGNDIQNLNKLTGRHLQEYRIWRQDTGELKKITLNQQMSTIRVFIKWCGSIEAVPPGLYKEQAECLGVVRKPSISVIGRTPRVRRHRESPIRSVTRRSASRTT